MKVLILDTLLKQASQNSDDHSRLTREVINRIHNEYGNLAALEKNGTVSLMAYINRQDGKPMLGVKDVYKYRLTDGDRIIYTRGSVLGYLAPEDKDSIVLMAYAKHDDQGRVAMQVAPWANPAIEHDYVSVQQFAALANELEVKLDAGEFNQETQEFLYKYLMDPSSVQSHRILVVPDDEYLNLDPEMQDVALSETQAAVVQNFNLKSEPTLILGGAGTGKTVICMHILNDFDNSNDGKTGIYFTQSQELLGKVEGKLEYLPKSQSRNDILLYDINDYCLELLQSSRTNLVETRQFIDFINSDNELLGTCERNALDPITVWTEIRGTIKGYMGKQWLRVNPMHQNEFAGSIDKLVKKKYFNRDSEDERLIVLHSSIVATINKSNEDTELSSDDILNIKKACEHFSTFDFNIRSLNKSQYEDLDDEDTTIEKDKRNAVWEIFQAYERWLIDNNRIDENDLIIQVLKKYQDNLPECNLVVVDEVQDYTELQIYLLFVLAKQSNGKIVFAGDVNQNVNPTYFSEDHLKLLFTDDTGRSALHINHLTANFRCSQEIVDVANKISTIRKKSIAAHSIEDEAVETAKRSGESPYRLLCTENNIRKLLETMMDYPRVALLVPDGNTKEHLINIIGKDHYERDSVAHFIFSVNEIKGMEYAYVICYNLSSFYKDIWDKILNTEEAKKKTKYRYYFNLLYVATTRAEKYLCFIDENLIEKLESNLALKSVENFDAVDLFFTSLSNTAEEQLKQAREFFDAGHYEDALHIYSRIGQAEDVYKCKLRLAEEKHNYEEALKLHMLINPWDPYKYINDVDKKSGLRKMHDAIYVDPKKKRKSDVSFADVILKYYADDEKQLNDMQDLMFERLSEGLIQSIETFEKFNYYSGV